MICPRIGTSNTGFLPCLSDKGPIIKDTRIHGRADRKVKYRLMVVTSSWTSSFSLSWWLILSQTAYVKFRLTLQDFSMSRFVLITSCSPEEKAWIAMASSILRILFHHLTTWPLVVVPTPPRSEEKVILTGCPAKHQPPSISSIFQLQKCVEEQSLAFLKAHLILISKLSWFLILASRLAELWPDPNRNPFYKINIF